ncbi:MAG TPA: flagellar protein FliS, partial [Candidatus Acidoferrum sp.]|nr:flagellar protein FliS [Candidatus Acidoferrum sp.]
ASGKSQLDLLVQIYDGTLTALQGAREAYSAHSLDAGYGQMERARRFIMHLYTTLDFEQGGEVADNLSRLYVYALKNIDLIEATKNPNVIDDTIRVVRNIRDGWAELKGRMTAPNAAPELREANAAGKAFETSA